MDLEKNDRELGALPNNDAIISWERISPEGALIKTEYEALTHGFRSTILREIVASMRRKGVGGTIAITQRVGDALVAQENIHVVNEAEGFHAGLPRDLWLEGTDVGCCVYRHAPT